MHTPCKNPEQKTPARCPAQRALGTITHTQGLYVFVILILVHNYSTRARAALNHSSLFTSLVLLDPVMEEVGAVPPSAPGRHPAQATASRLDTWPSLAEAEKFLRSRPFYTSWDPRVLGLYIVCFLHLLPYDSSQLIAAGAEIWLPVPSHNNIP